ncbi:peptide-methionine (S)-S-oxide reductase MsrA [Alcaligenaceae bacterium SJ-26]|nr:peptide-methionine (S)-S-oxide reductase MsrA [Alcaligenaceae bacterium SJ-26]
MSQHDKALFGGGCFWCTEAVFSHVRGVTAVVPGYAGGSTSSPSYQAVCRGEGGHIEVVEIVYDPGLVSYADLLRIFFATHDPTSQDRQGADAGIQYRSVVFYRDEMQHRQVREVIAELGREQVYAKPIVTQVLPTPIFWPAEEYHHNYFAQHPEQGYCNMVIAPKVAAFRKRFSALLDVS